MIEIPSDTKKNKFALTVSTILSGPFTFPAGTTLVSAIYDMKIDKELKEPFSMEIEHCVEVLEVHMSKLKLASAAVDFNKKSFVFTCVKNIDLFDRLNGSRKAFKTKESCIVCLLHEGPIL